MMFLNKKTAFWGVEHSKGGDKLKMIKSLLTL